MVDNKGRVLIVEGAGLNIFGTTCAYYRFSCIFQRLVQNCPKKLTINLFSARVFWLLIVVRIDEKPLRKPRNIEIGSRAVNRTEVEAARSKKTSGEWRE